MTNFLLIRHGHCDPVGRYIAGRSKGIHLSDTGKIQVTKLVNQLKDVEVSAIFSSPLERARETAGEISKSKGIDVSVSDFLQEIDYGLWTGKSFSELSDDPLWIKFNNQKADVRIPDGEMILEVASRMSNFIEKLRKIYKGNVLLVSHGDPIKSAIAHYSGIPLNYISRFDVQTASISTIAIDDYGARILSINDHNFQGNV